MAALFFIIINQFDNFRESEQQTKATIEISKKQRINDKSHTTLPQKATKDEKFDQLKR
jgi:hypothetical protein